MTIDRESLTTALSSQTLSFSTCSITLPMPIPMYTAAFLLHICKNPPCDLVLHVSDSDIMPPFSTAWSMSQCGLKDLTVADSYRFDRLHIDSDGNI